MSFLKAHWFGLVVSLITAFFILVFLIVLFAPRQDELKRGFIPCTEAMAEEMFACESNGKALCMLSAVVKNNFCDIDVIGAGLKSWLLGKQPRPWSNYYFEPQLSEEDAGAEEYRKTHPDIGAQMKKLNDINMLDKDGINEGQ